MKFCSIPSKLFSLVTFAYAISSAYASGDSGSGSGDDPWNDYGGDDNFYSFNTYGDMTMHWSDYSIKAEACINRGGSDIIVFSMFSSGNNECKKKSVGKYYVTVSQFVKAVSKDAEKAAELIDYDFDDPAALSYLQCTATSDDDGGNAYSKLGCKRNAWKALAVNAYSDQYCNEPLDSISYQIDLSETQIEYGTCQSCADWTLPSDDAVDDYLYTNSEYFSPLCSGVWNYKEICDGSCQRQMKQSMRGGGNRGYTGSQKFMLFFLSTVGFISMGAVLLVRKKMSTEDALLEEAQVERVGLKKDKLPKFFLGIVIFLLFLMIFKVKGLTFFFLVVIDVFLIGYWARLEFRQKGKINLGGFHLYGIDDEDRSIT